MYKKNTIYLPKNTMIRSKLQCKERKWKVLKVKSKNKRDKTGKEPSNVLNTMRDL